MTDPSRAERVRELFDELVGLDPDERRVRLREACGEDEALRRELESLLASAEEPGLDVDRMLDAVRPSEGAADRGGATEGGSPPEAEAAEHRLDEALAGRYRIRAEIGRGGMATVYEAVDVRHDRVVALKVIEPGEGSSTGSARFLREIALTASLDHPHIVPLLDSGSAGGRLYYVMPRVDGESLRDRLDREKQLPLEEALRITREVADALDYAHGHQIVHRDVKPENILLSAGHARVADFGVARALAAAGHESLTRAGTALGTLTYMSPEQATGQREVDARSDVYSLACVTYEMLAGEPPHHGRTPEAIVARKLSGETTSVRTLRPNAPEEVDRAIGKALEGVPGDRYGSAGDFAAALGAPGADAPGGTRSVGPSLPRGGLVTAAVVGLLVLALVLALGLFDSPAPQRGATSGSGSPADARMAREERGERPSIAVLSFENLSAEPDDEPFVRGIHDELLAQLGKIRSLEVKSLTSVLQYRDTPKNLTTIGEELRSEYIVEGGVQRAGSTVQIRVRLHRARTDQQLWQEDYRREWNAANVLEIQREIALEVASRLGAEILPAERARLEVAPPDNDLAYERYLEGLYHLREVTLGTGSGADRLVAKRRGREALEEAIEADPEWAPSHAALGTLLHWDAGDRGMDSSRVVLEEAIRLDPTYAPAWASLGYVLFRGERDFEAAREALERARDLGFPEPHGRALLFTAWGRWDEAEAEFDRAVTLDPQSLITRGNRGYMFLCRGDFTRAADELEATRDLWPGNEYVGVWLARAYFETGRHREGLEELTRLGASGRGPAVRAYLYALADSTERAEALLARSEEDGDPVTLTHAAAAVALGDWERAVRYLERALDEGSGVLFVLCADLGELAGDPRYERILDSLGIPEEARR